MPVPYTYFKASLENILEIRCSKKFSSVFPAAYVTLIKPETMGMSYVLESYTVIIRVNTKGYCT